MKNPLARKSWSPFVVGACIGVLSWFAFLTADHPLGITTAFEHSAALLIGLSAPQAVATHAYFQQHDPKIGWEWMLVVGVFIGALISAATAGDRTSLVVPSLWKWRFGESVWRRLAAAFFGGGLMMFGARLANGCTSGHGISGSLQLAASSWLFSVIFFGTSIATAFALFGREGRRHV